MPDPNPPPNEVCSRNISYVICSVNLCSITSKLKLQMLKDFTYSNHIDILLLQEVAISDFSFLRGYRPIININENLRGTAILIRDPIPFNNVRMLESSRGIAIDVFDYSIVNLYAPSGTQHRAERHDFFVNELPKLLLGRSEKIIGGDFNCIIDRSDASNPNYENICLPLKSLVHAMNLVDAWRMKSSDPGFTYFHSKGASRLDRFYIRKASSPLLGSCTLHPTAFSDHRAITISIKMSNARHPTIKGLWKLNNSILKDQEVQLLFARNWQSWGRQKCKFPSTIRWWSDYVKPRIQSFLKWQSAVKRKENRATIEFYYQCLRHAMDKSPNDPGTFTEIKKYKALIIKHHSTVLEGCQIRSRTKEMIPGEATSIYHIMKEERQKRFKNISEITHEGETIIGDQQIAENITAYYRELYSEKSFDCSRANNWLQSKIQTKLTDEDNSRLMEEYPEDEVYSRLKESRHNKSPGPDGLTVEFYAEFWLTIKEAVVEVINEINRGVQIPQSFTEGIIVLVPKTAAPKEIKELRPISLLNTDYKLYMRCMKARASRCVGKLLGNNQVCAVPGQSIMNALCHLREEVVLSNINRTKKLMLNLDLDHAFDRVSHGYLWWVLERYNFPKKFIENIKNLYNNAYSRLQINRDTSNVINIRCSVRQGCPMSMLLFVLYLQPFIELLKTDTTKPTAFADDITLMVQDMTELGRIKQKADVFCGITNASLNTDKCRGLFIGSNSRGPTLTTAEIWFGLEQNLKILGVVFSNNLQDMIRENWKKAVNVVQASLINNRTRRLGIIQKVFFVNTYALSKIWFLSQVLPMPKLTAKRLYTIGGFFIWANTINRIARTTLILPKQAGGLGLQDALIKSNALLIIRTLRYKESTDNNMTYVTLDEAVGNPPNLAAVPHQAPHMKRIIGELAYVDVNNVSAATTSKALYSTLLLQDSNSYEQPFRRKTKMWKCVFNKRLSNTQRELLYRIAHNCFVSQVFLHKIGKATTDKCTLCFQEQDTMLHRFRCYGEVREISQHLVRCVKHITADSQTTDEILLSLDYKFQRPIQNVVTMLMGTTVEYVWSAARGEAKLAEYKSWVKRALNTVQLEREEEKRLIVEILKVV